MLQCQKFDKSRRVGLIVATRMLLAMNLLFTRYYVDLSPSLPSSGATVHRRSLLAMLATVAAFGWTALCSEAIAETSSGDEGVCWISSTPADALPPAPQKEIAKTSYLRSPRRSPMRYGTGMGTPGNQPNSSLPGGWRYYRSRYFGNFNNRFYGPQYGYF